MTSQQIKDITIGTGKTVNTIEKELKIPQGTLGKAMNGIRELPAKWDAPLLRYSKKNKIVEVIKAVVAKEEVVEVTENVLPDWVNEIESFCNLNNITYMDLMLSYKDEVYKKPDESLLGMLPKVPKNESYFEKRQREAIGK